MCFAWRKIGVYSIQVKLVRQLDLSFYVPFSRCIKEMSSDQAKKTDEYIRAVLGEFELEYEYVEKHQQYVSQMPSGESLPILGCMIRNDSKRETVVCTIMMQKDLSNDCLAAVVEFITRANFGLSFGNFDVDIETASVQFRTSVCFLDTKPDKAMIRNTLGDAIDSFLFFLPNLLTVIEGTQEPVDAYESALEQPR